MNNQTWAVECENCYSAGSIDGLICEQCGGAGFTYEAEDIHDSELPFNNL